MSSYSAERRVPRARPVADAPVQALLADADELARRWALALLGTRSLPQMAELPLRDLAEEAPALCAQVIRALDSDAELEQLAAVGSSSPMPVAALVAADAAAAVAHIEELRGVLWEALLEQLDSPSSERRSVRLVSDLSDRLAHVCATTLGAMLAADTSRVPQTAPRASREHPIFSSTHSAAGRPAAVLIDEREDRATTSSAVRASAPDRAGAGLGAFAERPLDPAEARRRSEAQAAEARPRPRPWDPVMRVTRATATPDDRPERSVEG